MKSSIAPWLSVINIEKAIAFYKAAFGALEVYRLEPSDGGVARLSVNGAEFWLSAESGNDHSTTQLNSSIRMILTVTNPDAFFSQALQEGATEIFPVGEDHGWRLGRLSDPFGFQWEIGYPLEK